MIADVKILLIFAAVLLVCSIGFKKYIWFISIGYGFAIATVGIMLLALYGKELNLLKLIACLTLIAYGIRLSGYLVYRESKQHSYKKTVEADIKDGSSVNVFLKIALWLSCGLLYMCMTSPIVFRFNNGSADNVWFAIGLIIMIIGIYIEATADSQKNNAKKKNPGRFVDTGLYRLVRCPNYLGEIIIWTGCFITGIGALKGVLQWIAAIAGYLGIIYIMFSGARRLELRQDRNYGDDPEYQKYKSKTPILIPWVKLYSVKDQKWLVG